MTSSDLCNGVIKLSKQLLYSRIIIQKNSIQIFFQKSSPPLSLPLPFADNYFIFFHTHQHEKEKMFTTIF